MSPAYPLCIAWKRRDICSRLLLRSMRSYLCMCTMKLSETCGLHGGCLGSADLTFDHRDPEIARVLPLQLMFVVCLSITAEGDFGRSMISSTTRASRKHDLLVFSLRQFRNNGSDIWSSTRRQALNPYPWGNYLVDGSTCKVAGQCYASLILLQSIFLIRLNSIRLA